MLKLKHLRLKLTKTSKKHKRTPNVSQLNWLNAVMKCMCWTFSMECWCTRAQISKKKKITADYSWCVKCFQQQQRNHEQQQQKLLQKMNSNQKTAVTVDTFMFKNGARQCCHKPKSHKMTEYKYIQYETIQYIQLSTIQLNNT